MKGMKTLLSIVAALAAVIGVGLLGALLRPEKPPGRITVGVILPETGILAEMGQYERQAMELAAEHLKAEGKSVQLVFEDGKGDNKVVAAAANELVDVNDVDIFITSTTGASLTVQPIAERSHRPLLAFCMSSEIATTSPGTVRFYIGIEDESDALKRYLAEFPRDSKVGMLHADVAIWTTAVEHIYKPFIDQHFSAPPVIERYDLNTNTIRPQLTKLKSEGVKVLVILGYGFEYNRLFTQLEELKMRDSLTICGGWGFLYTNVAPNPLEGIRVAGPKYVFDRGARGADFEASFTKAYGRPPNFDAAFAYEVIRRLPDIENLLRKESRSQFKRALSDRQEFEGVMGKHRFTEAGNMIVETAVGVYRNGIIVGESR